MEAPAGVIAEQIGRANRRPASPLNAGRQFGSALCAQPFRSAAVAHLSRSAYQYDLEIHAFDGDDCCRARRVLAVVASFALD